MEQNTSDKETESNLSDLDRAKALWGLLDDIDTASDMFKPRDENSYKAFYNYAMKKQAERHKYLESDGYTLSN